MRRGHPDTYYVEKWRSLEILPGNDYALAKAPGFLIKNQERYAPAEALGIPWYVAGLLHIMEAGTNEAWTFNLSMSNGMPWNEKNAHSRRPMGPHKSFEEDMLRILNYELEDIRGFESRPYTWGIGDISRFADCWNGYEKYAKLGLPSPYLYAGSNHGRGVGKFKRAIIKEDGSREITDVVTNSDRITSVYVADAENKQCGIITLLKWIDLQAIFDLQINEFQEL